MLTKTNTSSPEGKTLKVLLVQRGWSYQDMARHIPCSGSIIQRNASEDFRDKVFQSKAERLFGVAIWRSAHEFNRSRHAEAVFGFDPACLRKTDLKAKARELRLTGWTGIRHRHELVDFFLKLAASNPRQLQTA